MSTQVREFPDHYEVTTIFGPGKRRRIPRNPVRVGKSNPQGLLDEVIKQAEAARAAVGLTNPPRRPVE